MPTPPVLAIAASATSSVRLRPYRPTTLTLHAFASAVASAVPRRPACRLSPSHPQRENRPSETDTASPDRPAPRRTSVFMSVSCESHWPIWPSHISRSVEPTIPLSFYITTLADFTETLTSLTVRTNRAPSASRIGIGHCHLFLFVAKFRIKIRKYQTHTTEN